jgi:hypothetical protein
MRLNLLSNIVETIEAIFNYDPGSRITDQGTHIIKIATY